MRKFPIKKHSHDGCIFDIWGVQISKSDPDVHLGGLFEHFTSHATYAPSPAAHSCLLILFETSICPNAIPTAIRRRRHGGRQQRHGEKAAGRMTTRRKSTLVSDCKNLFVRQKLSKCCSCQNCQAQREVGVGGGGGGQHQEESTEG